MVPDADKEHLLIVDDSADTREVIRRNLLSQGFNVFTAESVAEAVNLLESTPIDLVITDLKMPGASGLDLVRHVRENYKEIEVMMITGFPTVEGAVTAVKSGANDYLSKPFTRQELLTAVGNALEKLRMRRIGLDHEADADASPFGIVAESKAMVEVFDSIRKAAGTSATILVTGESGTGKELVARAIHYKSKSAASPFVPVNCGGIPQELLESELFGHLMQVKLLRVLQDKEVRMVGSTRAKIVNVRILAATNKDLTSLVEKGLFRDDLFYRINVITIAVPPLRVRGDDVLLLMQHFIQKFSEEYEKPAPEISDRALEVMKSYSWPGNVRELENIIQRLVVMTEGDIVDVPDLPSLMRFSAPREPGLRRTLAEVEFEHIRNVLSSVGGNKTRAAEILGIDRKTLRDKLKRSDRTK